jgi:hypothetical protein
MFTTLHEWSDALSLWNAGARVIRLIAADAVIRRQWLSIQEAHLH